MAGNVTPDFDTIYGLVSQAIEGAKRTVVTPREFFVSWNGVITLAYEGFTPPLVNIKRIIHYMFQEKSANAEGLKLKKEGGGSKWPKTTLAAVNDQDALAALTDKTTLVEVDDKWELTRRSLKKLRHLCCEFNDSLDENDWTLGVDELKLVEFSARSLAPDKRRERAIELATPVDESKASGPEKAVVEKTMSEFDERELRLYYLDVVKQGGRLRHYTEAHTELTLVCDLPSDIPKAVAELRGAVENALPGVYTWFEEGLHMTIRGLVFE